MTDAKKGQPLHANQIKGLRTSKLKPLAKEQLDQLQAALRGA